MNKTQTCLSCREEETKPKARQTADLDQGLPRGGSGLLSKVLGPIAGQVTLELALRSPIVLQAEVVAVQRHTL